MKTNSLILRMRDRRDNDAWVEFQDRFGAVIRDWCKKWCRSSSADVVDECVQEILTKLVRSIRQFDPAKGHFRGWLHEVSRNAVTDLLRRWKREPKGIGGSDAAEWFDEVKASTDLNERLAEEFKRHLFELASERVCASVAPEKWDVFTALTAPNAADHRTVAKRFEIPIARTYKIRTYVTERLKREIEALTNGH